MLITLQLNRKLGSKPTSQTAISPRLKRRRAQLIDERIAARAAEETDDLAWGRALWDEARKAVARVSLSLSRSTRPIMRRFSLRSKLEWRGSSSPYSRKRDAAYIARNLTAKGGSRRGREIYGLF